MTPKRLFNHRFVLLFFSLLALSLCHSMFCVEIPLYLTDRGYGTSVSGYLTAAFAVVAMLSRVFGGRLTDKFRKRTVVAVGAALYGLGCLGFAGFSMVALLLLSRMLQGMGFSVSTTASYALCADVCPPERMSEGVAYFGITQNIASAFSAMLVLAFIKWTGYESSFLFSAALAAAAVLLVLPVGGSSGAPEKKEKERFSIHNYFEKSALPVGLIQFLVNLGFGVVGMYLTLFAVSRGYANPGLFFTISTVVMMVTKAAAGRFGERIPTLAILVGCSLFGAASLFLIAWVDSELVLYAAGVLYGVGSGANIARLDAEVYLRAPVERRGAATATYMFFADIAFGLSGLLWGLLMDYLPYATVFAICGGVLLLSAAVTPALYRIGRPKTQKTA